jgi:serine/threonine protein kinase
VKVYELYIDEAKSKMYTIMELVNGKEMFQVIQGIGHYSENVARQLFKQILEAI